MFSKAVLEWQWVGFKNPCSTIKLGKSDRRFVAMTDNQRDAVQKCLTEFDNPYLYSTCMRTSLRLKGAAGSPRHRTLLIVLRGVAALCHTPGCSQDCGSSY